MVNNRSFSYRRNDRNGIYFQDAIKKKYHNICKQEDVITSFSPQFSSRQQVKIHLEYVVQSKKKNV